MEKGIFYGISVGPGDPDLITIATLKAVENCTVLAVPRTAKEDTLALNILSGAMDINGKEVIYLDFLMLRDKALRNKSHIDMANTIIKRLDAGENVGMLNLGDVSVYSTCSYIVELLKGYEIKLIAGVTSFCASAAELKIPLCVGEAPLHIIPTNVETLEELDCSRGNYVLMKSGKQIQTAVEILKQKGVTDRCFAVSNCGLTDQKVFHDIEKMKSSESYFSTIIIKE